MRDLELRCDSCGARFLAHAGRGDWHIDAIPGARVEVEDHHPDRNQWDRDGWYGIWGMPGCNCANAGWIVVGEEVKACPPR